MGKTNTKRILSVHCIVMSALKTVLRISIMTLKYFNFSHLSVIGWSKNPVSSQTDRLMAATIFSDYLGLNHYKKAKKIKYFIHLRLTNQPQSLSTYHSISPIVYSDHKP